MKSLKPYLAQSFYQWCLDENLTPVLYFYPQGNLNQNLKEFLKQHSTEELYYFKLSSRFAKGVEFSNQGVRFWIRTKKGVIDNQVPLKNTMEIFIPLEAWERIAVEERGQVLPLDFLESEEKFERAFEQKEPQHLKLVVSDGQRL